MAIAVSPGMVVGSDEWDAIFEQHGRQPENLPPANISPKPADDNYMPRDKQQPVYRYFLADGSTVDARTSQDGNSWEIVAYKPSKEYTQTQSPAAQAANRPTTPHTEGTPTGRKNPDGTPEFDNTKPIQVHRDASGQQVGAAEELTATQRARWERDKNAGKTDAELSAPVKTPDDEVNPSDPTRLRKPDGKGGWTDAGPNAAGVQAAATANAPVITNHTINGQAGYRTETTKGQNGQPSTQKHYGPDGKEIPQLPAESSRVRTPVKNKPGIYEVKAGTGNNADTYYEDESGNRVPTPVDGDKVPIPGDYPAYAPDYSHQDGDLGLTSYARQVRGLKNLTKEQQDQLIKEAHGVASTVISRNTSTINTQEGIRNAGITQRGQDSTQANARLSAAASISTNAISQAAEQTKYSTGPDAMAVAPYYMMLGRALVQSMGGLENAPRIEDGPALRQAGQMLLAGQGLPSVAGAIAGPSGPFPPPAMATPALAAPMPAAPDLAVPAGPPAAIGPAPLPAPIFRPQQPSQLPPAALPPAPPRTLGPGQDLSAPQGAMPPGGGVAAMLGAGPWQPPQMQQPTGAVGVQMAAAQGYDPTGVNQMWLDAGIDPEIVAMFGGGAPAA